MTVLERIVVMVGTGYTGTSLLLGNTLLKVVSQVVDDLNNNSKMLGEDMLFYEENENYYSPYFYHIAWHAFIRPTVEVFLRKELPHAWFNQFYIPNLNIN